MLLYNVPWYLVHFVVIFTNPLIHPHVQRGTTPALRVNHQNFTISYRRNRIRTLDSAYLLYHLISFYATNLSRRGYILVSFINISTCHDVYYAGLIKTMLVLYNRRKRRVGLGAFFILVPRIRRPGGYSKISPYCTSSIKQDR
jgi:hypothetical protein